MAAVNKVILVGNLGRDPEVRYTKSGQAVANFSLATSEKYKDRDGQQQEKTEWHRIVMWGRSAEIAGEYLAKGRQIYLEGRLQTRDWEDKEGNKRYTTEVVVQNFQMLGSRRDAEGGGGGGGDYGGPASGGGGSSGGDSGGGGGDSFGGGSTSGGGASDDEIPF